jgi:prolyl 4-hydroxylase
MKANGCYAFCYYCEYLHIESVCPIDVNEKNALYPGDVNALFTNIIEQFNETYDVTVLSRPYVADENDDNENEEDQQQDNRKDGPWIIQLDNFLTPEEANTMIELGTKIGYTRSNQVGELDEFGKNKDHVSNHRTSLNAWCDTDECMEHEVTKRLYERIDRLTSINSDHSESIQLLQYSPGQYYRTHSDYIEYEIHRQQGVRILTIFIYLNTLPEYTPTEDEIKPDIEGSEYDEDNDDSYTEDDTNRKFTLDQYRTNGGTNFPHLNLTVLPKVGRVVMWTNVLNDYPNHIEDRVDHQALVVTHGTKYGANFWYHQRAFTCEEEE